MYKQWVIENIGSQRLMQKVLRMVDTQTENVINVFQNKYERGCGNSQHKLSEVSTMTVPQGVITYTSQRTTFWTLNYSLNHNCVRFE